MLLGLDYFLFHVGEIFNYNLFKNFLRPFISPFFFWDPCNLNVGAFDIVPEVSGASLVSQLVKNLPAMQLTWVQSLGWKDPLEKGKAALSSILAWRILYSGRESDMTEQLSAVRTLLSHCPG